MQDPIYREVILDHWHNPQNAGEVKHPDFSATDQNPYCGDKVTFTGKLTKGKITEIKFIGEGCAISIASASILSEYVKGLSLQAVSNLTQADYLAIIGMEIGTTRLKCSLFIYSTLKSALTKAQLMRDNIRT